MNKVTKPSEVDEYQSWFDKAAGWCSSILGKSLSFVFAIVIILIWATTGPLFGFNDTWQLVINTSTTILTFLFLFLLQNTQNRQDAASQKKLNAISEALVDIMEHHKINDDEVKELKAAVGLELRESS
jgi:low affinity Fe/Cu permease